MLIMQNPLSRWLFLKKKKRKQELGVVNHLELKMKANFREALVF